MSILQLILIGVGLAMDAFAVTICIAASNAKLRLGNMLLIALFFGGFQALMPYLGWQTSVFASSYISKIDHWIAAILLYYIGGKMFLEGIRDKNCLVKTYTNPTSLYLLFTLAIATSIDALAVGVSFGCLKMEILEPIVIIGSVTFLITFAGAILGKRISHYVGGKAEVIGGIILVVIGTKILIEHLFFE